MCIIRLLIVGVFIEFYNFNDHFNFNLQTMESHSLTTMHAGLRTGLFLGGGGGGGGGGDLTNDFLCMHVYMRMHHCHAYTCTCTSNTI